MSSEEEDYAYEDAEYSDDDSYGPNRDSVVSTGGRASKQYRKTRGFNGGSIVNEAAIK